MWRLGTSEFSMCLRLDNSRTSSPKACHRHCSWIVDLVSASENNPF
jgi:hypothetical protein